MFDQKKWAALLIATVWLNTCDGEIRTGEITCWDKDNIVMCHTAKDCSWNPDVFPNKTGEHKCKTDSGNIKCIQTPHPTCSSYEDCGFSYTPLHIGLCTISWKLKIRCWDENKVQTCDTPEGCRWNADAFHNKTGDYRCETVFGEMQCFETSHKTEKCFSNKECGFTHSFSNDVSCSMSFPDITCLNRNNLFLCNTHKDCRWNPDKFPNKSGAYTCTSDFGALSCTSATHLYKYEPTCSSYEKCGFKNKLDSRVNCAISWVGDPIGDKDKHQGNTTEKTATWTAGYYVGLVIAVLVVFGIGFGIGFSILMLRRKRAEREEPVPPHEMEPLGTFH